MEELSVVVEGRRVVILGASAVEGWWLRGEGSRGQVVRRRWFRSWEVVERR